jgi:hypothetical protein
MRPPGLVGWIILVALGVAIGVYVPRVRVLGAIYVMSHYLGYDKASSGTDPAGSTDISDEDFTLSAIRRAPFIPGISLHDFSLLFRPHSEFLFWGLVGF